MRNFTKSNSGIAESLENKTIVVTTIKVRKNCKCIQIRIFSFQSPPYSMFKESPEKLVGNDAFEGYAVELIDEMSKILSIS